MKNTVRVIITQECNLSCSYCCNKISAVNSKFKQIFTHDLEILLPSYENICITGGEPLLNLMKVFHILSLKRPNQKVYLYTNGLYLNENLIEDLIKKGVDGINIGIHDWSSLGYFFNQKFHTIDKIRFHIEDTRKDKIPKRFIDKFVFWHRNSCEMPNEDWYVLNN